MSKISSRAAGLFLLALFPLVCSGCTKQPNTDLPEFCKRFNQITDSNALTSENFFCETPNAPTALNTAFPMPDGSEALLCLTTNEAGTVIGIQLTCVANGFQNTPQAFAALYRVFLAACAVLQTQSLAQAETDVRTAGILPEQLAFTDTAFSAEHNHFHYAVFGTAAYLSLFCKRI